MALLGSNVVEEKCRRTNKLSLHTRKAPQPLHRITTSTGALQLPPQQNGIIARHHHPTLSNASTNSNLSRITDLRGCRRQHRHNAQNARLERGEGGPAAEGSRAEQAEAPG
jgi:hypothetical protein